MVCDINLERQASDVPLNTEKRQLCLSSPDYYNGTFQVVAKVGEKSAGSQPMIDKKPPEIVAPFPPVSGEVTAVNRGEKRKCLASLLSRTRRSSTRISVRKCVFTKSEEVKEALLNGGMWLIKQRPRYRSYAPSMNRVTFL